MDKAEIAILTSLGSLTISLGGLLFSIHSTRKARRIERARAYDKVYYDASDLLIYSYKTRIKEPYTSEDKFLEKAVNEYENQHWLEQMYGFNFEYPEHIESEDDRRAYRRKVREEYDKNQHEKHVASFSETMANRSPVFNLENQEYAERFNRLLDHVTHNLSYFSPSVVDCWEKMRLLTPDKVRIQYISLRRVNESACQPVREPIEDPYLGILLIIRHEYRELNKPLRKKLAEYWYNFTTMRYRIKRVVNWKRQ
ncbi:hypothetical protein RPW65_00365 [Pseudomonas sp. NyZ704]|nr:hypothetical protein RPW65_00365 [Pseudomonas sp. NyZ704]